MSNDAFEKALTKRLAKLSTLPVDMEGVERRVQERMQGGVQHGVLGGVQQRVQGGGQDGEQGGVQQGSQGGAQDGEQGRVQQGVHGGGQGGVQEGVRVGDGGWSKPRIHRFPRMWRTAVGIAASIALVAIVGMAMLQSRPAQASLMVQLHRDIVAGKMATMKVDSISEVNEAFAAFGKNGFQMNAPDMHVMSCCMHNVGNKQVYCVLLNEGNVPVTLTIADLGAVQAARGGTVAYKGESYHVEQSAELTMVTVDRGGHRVCLIGAVPAEKLMGLAEGVKF